ncbi:MAG TPA: hypothetical protein VKV25_10650, partial [Acidimicrobiales bacterium]|nr:hypothetical protein [Acidimicrobiales bacterium]
LSHEELQELGEQIERAKAAAPTHPHPQSPNTGAGATIAGAAAGLMDKAKDAITGRPADER